MNFNTIVLSGGSICTISSLGALQYFYDNNQENNIDTYAGNSAGAMIAYLLTIGYTPMELLIYLCTHDIFDHIQSLDIVSMLNGRGAISFAGFQEHLEKLTIEKIGRLVTFKDVQEKLNKRLVMTTYNYSKKQMEILSPETTPDLPCLTAIRMSCCLPFVFDMYKYNQSFYLDGGVYNDFPLHIFNEDDNKVLGIYIDIEQEGEDELPKNLVEYFYKLMLIPRETNIKVLKENEHVHIMKIKSDIMTFFNYKITRGEKIELFTKGYDASKLNLTSL